MTSIFFNPYRRDQEECDLNKLYYLKRISSFNNMSNNPINQNTQVTKEIPKYLKKIFNKTKSDYKNIMIHSKEKKSVPKELNNFFIKNVISDQEDMKKCKFIF